MQARLYLLGVFLSIVTAGCNTTVSIDPPNFEPLVEPSPVSIAIYYAEDLRDHECTTVGGFAFDDWTIRLGPPSIEMFDKLFRDLFKKVEDLDAAPDWATASSDQTVIELRLLDYDGCDADWIYRLSRNGIYIAYEAIVWSAKGEEVARWEGRGQAGPEEHNFEHSFWNSVTDYFTVLTSLAMRKAAADFIVNYSNDPDVQSWAAE